MQRLHFSDCEFLEKTGIRSLQILWPKNAPDARVTITHVTMEPGAISHRHIHERSEQTWIVEQGEGMLLLADGHAERLTVGDIVRTPPGETHGVKNIGTGPLVYLAVTAPPEDFTSAYSTNSESN